MKTYKNLFEKIVNFDNLILASQKAQRGKRFKKSVATFNLKLESNLLNIQKELLLKTYCPKKYTNFYIFDSKKRMISAANYSDRVIHHALCNIIQPILEQSFIFDSYANRIGKGTHKAIKRLQYFMQNEKNKYVFRRCLCPHRRLAK